MQEESEILKNKIKTLLDSKCATSLYELPKVLIEVVIFDREFMNSLQYDLVVISQNLKISAFKIIIKTLC